MTRKSDSDQGKKESGGYPYLPLNLAMKVADAVKELGGNRSDVQKSTLARHLGESEKSATFSQKITSAKCFGLIDGHGAYSLTEPAKRYYFPTSDTDKESALLEIFSTPVSFQKLIHTYDGDLLPSRSILGNVLHRQLGVSESWKDRVAAFFSNSAQFVGAIDNQGFLRFRASQHLPTTAAAKEVIPVPTDIFPKPQPAAQAKADDGMVVWSYPYKGKTVQIIAPIDMEMALWQKLSLYIDLLKPPDGK